LTGANPKKYYPQILRMVRFYDEEKKREFIFLTNNNKLKASKVALLYKQRWQVELFFKWIKQHLQVKKFWRQSENAVKIQIYVAIITYCIVSIIKYKLGVKYSIYEILQIVGASLLDTTPLEELLSQTNFQHVKDQTINDRQLNVRFLR
jgi:transposase